MEHSEEEQAYEAQMTLRDERYSDTMTNAEIVTIIFLRQQTLTLIAKLDGNRKITNKIANDIQEAISENNEVDDYLLDYVKEYNDSAIERLF